MKKFFKVVIDQDKSYKTLNGVRNALTSEKWFTKSDVVEVSELTPSLISNLAKEAGLTRLVLTQDVREKTLKESIKFCEKADCALCSYNFTEFCRVNLTFDLLKSAQSAQPQLPMVETGVIELPDNSVLNCLGKRAFQDGDTVNLVAFPQLRKYCKPESIKTEVDYSKIPVGSVVIINNESCGIVSQNKDKVIEIKTDLSSAYYMPIDYSEIKSLQILQLPEGK
jgi:hypothetical protein